MLLRNSTKLSLLLLELIIVLVLVVLQTEFRRTSVEQTGRRIRDASSSDRGGAKGEAEPYTAGRLIRATERFKRAEEHLGELLLQPYMVRDPKELDRSIDHVLRAREHLREVERGLGGPFYGTLIQ